MRIRRFVQDWHPPPGIAKIVQLPFTFGEDREGHALFRMRFGVCDNRGLHKAVGLAVVERCFMWALETIRARVMVQHRRRGVLPQFTAGGKYREREDMPCCILDVRYRVYCCYCCCCCCGGGWWVVVPCC